MDSNRLLQAGDTDYNYDAAGNPVQIGDRVLTYNSENRLVTVEAGGAAVASYDYNALGQRYVKRTPNGDIYFVYDLEGRLIGEYDAQGAAVREYVYLDGEPLAMLRPDGDEVDVFYFHNDHRGAPQSLFAHEGDEGSGGHYKPFGERYDNWMSFDQPIWESRPPDLRLRYPGQYGDNETGFYYNYFRDYEPQTGRYVESDPIGLDGGINTYAYAISNPLRFSDPLGLKPTCTCTVTCTSTPLTVIVYCQMKRVCVDECGNKTTTVTSGFYNWSNRNFAFVGGFFCEDFPQPPPRYPGPVPPPQFTGPPGIDPRA